MQLSVVYFSTPRFVSLCDGAAAVIPGAVCAVVARRTLQLGRRCVPLSVLSAPGCAESAPVNCTAAALRPSVARASWPSAGGGDWPPNSVKSMPWNGGSNALHSRLWCVMYIFVYRCFQFHAWSYWYTAENRYRCALFEILV